MSYDTEKVRLGAEPVTMCGIVADYCARTYATFTAENATNYLLYSEQLENAAWTISGLGTVVADAIIAPDGTLTADRLKDSSTVIGKITLSQAITVADDSATRALSFYVKNLTAVDTTIELVYSGGTTVTETCTFNWSSKTVDNGAVEALTNDWYRLQIPATNNTSGNTTLTAYIYPSGKTSTSKLDIYAWGAMINDGATAAGYIKTTTVAVTEASRTGCLAGQISTDTAQAGSATTITLAAGESAVDSFYNDMTVYISSGTGAGQTRTITAYVGATKVATVATWTINPDATSVYIINDPTSATACVNTRAQCQDISNYSKITKEYIFSQPRSSLPIGQVIYPLIEGKVNKSGTSTTAGSGLGKRAVVNVRLKDMTHHDRGIDPYVANRTYVPEEQGTFWGKWIKRNPYYEGRTLKVYHGYIGETFAWTDFEVQEFDIIDIAGPNNGYVTLTAKDILVRTYDRKSQYPAASEGTLLAGIAAGATSATLTPTGIGDSDYPDSGTLSIGKEAMTFTRVSDVLTLTRAQWGTTDTAHAAGDTVQICAVWDGTPATDNVTDVLYELLVTGAGLPSAYIPTADWDIEQDLWLSSATVKGILMKPESIEKVIGELSEVFMFDIWWDSVAQTVNIKALSPEPSGITISTLSEGNHIKQGSLKIERRSAERFTQIRCYYGKVDYSEDNKPEKFRSLQISTDVSRASADRYDGDSIKTVVSRWFEAGANAAQLTGRLLARFADTPEYVTFLLDNKDHGKMVMAGRLEIDSWQFQDEFGANEPRKFQVLEINPKDNGHDFEVKCLTSSFVGRYGFIMAAGSVDYTAATTDQKDSGMWICQADGTFSDGSTGYKII